MDEVKIIKGGFYYSLKSKSFWKVYDVDANGVKAVNMITGADIQYYPVTQFAKAIQDGNLKLDKHQTDLYRTTNKIK